ncbi:MAG: hypothetical protein BJ554DRAFT_4212, partial [Olpidium bornovanus]
MKDMEAALLQAEDEEEEDDQVNSVQDDRDGSANEERVRAERLERFHNDDLTTTAYHGSKQEHERSQPPEGNLNTLLARTLLGAIPTCGGTGGTAALTNFVTKLEMAAERA